MAPSSRPACLTWVLAALLISAPQAASVSCESANADGNSGQTGNQYVAFASDDVCKAVLAAIAAGGAPGSALHLHCTRRSSTAFAIQCQNSVTSCTARVKELNRALADAATGTKPPVFDLISEQPDGSPVTYNTFGVQWAGYAVTTAGSARPRCEKMIVPLQKWLKRVTDHMCVPVKTAQGGDAGHIFSVKNTAWNCAKALDSMIRTGMPATGMACGARVGLYCTKKEVCDRFLLDLEEQMERNGFAFSNSSGFPRTLSHTAVSADGASVYSIGVLPSEGGSTSCWSVLERIKEWFTFAQSTCPGTKPNDDTTVLCKVGLQWIAIHAPSVCGRFAGLGLV